MPESAISLRHIFKSYKRYVHPTHRLRELLRPGARHAESFEALHDVSLDLARGDTLGVIGRNGSGKSTLLQIVAGTLQPTSGEIAVNGRIAALLELGSGFNPEFTGRQNVEFNGQILGLTPAEIGRKFDAIAAFADIGDFLDQPVKTYSTGMTVRLAFAVAAHIDPDILLVDEALAVGDMKFQARCLKRIRLMKEQGVTILFVSHDLSSVRILCNRAVLLDGGRVVCGGEPKDTINRYIALLSAEPAEAATPAGAAAAAAPAKEHGNKKAVLRGVRLLDEAQREAAKFTTGSRLSVEVDVEAGAALDDVVVGISIRNLMGLVIYGTNTLLSTGRPLSLVQGERSRVSFSVPCLMNRGVYTLTVGLHSEEGVSYDWRDELVVFEVVSRQTCDGVVDLGATIDVQRSEARREPERAAAERQQQR